MKKKPEDTLGSKRERLVTEAANVLSAPISSGYVILLRDTNGYFTISAQAEGNAPDVANLGRLIEAELTKAQGPLPSFDEDDGA